jgi:hypothetical protein
LALGRNSEIRQIQKEEATVAMGVQQYSGPIRTEVRSKAMPAGVATGAVTILTLLTGLIAGVAALVGVFWEGSNAPAIFTSVHGETIKLYRDGIYGYDSIFKGAANRGSDVVTLGIAIPLLMATLVRYRRGSMGASLLLLGTLVWFLYVSVSLAFGTAYNEFYLAYVALFAASLLAVVLLFQAINGANLASHVSSSMPHRVPGIFMLISGVVTFGIWLQPLVSALIEGEPPMLLDGSTTMVTDTLDLGVIVPAAILSGVLILRRRTVGYILAFSLLVMEALLAPMIVMQTIYQLDAGVDLFSGEAIGAIGGFTAIALAATWIILLLLRNISDAPSPNDGNTRG